MRIYNPSLGRFLSVDPLTKDYPYKTPYDFAENSPIENIDLEGKEKLGATIGFLNSGGKTLYSVARSNDVLTKLLITAISSQGFSDKQFIFLAAYSGDKIAYTSGNFEQYGAVINYQENKDVADYMKKGAQENNFNEAKNKLNKYGLMDNKNLIQNYAAKGKMVHVLGFNEDYLSDITSGSFKDSKGNFNIPLFIGLAAWAHENNSHLMNIIYGKVSTEQKDHLDYFNVANHPELAKTLQGGNSPSFSNLPKDSKAYSDVLEIFKAMGGDEKKIDTFLKDVDTYIKTKKSADK